MARDNSRRSGPPGATVTGALALLLVICLAECATEQRINSRGSKPHIEKINAWRSQRGASCLKYGHSCWGGHGKRSAKPPSAATDWFLSKLLRRVDANNNNDMERIQRASDDSSGIYLEDSGINSPSTNQFGTDNEDYSMEVLAPRRMGAKPMLDDELLSNMKLWKIMTKRPTSLEE